jgi:hypothetical protein
MARPCLQGAMRADHDPYGCRNGACGTAGKILDGEIDYGAYQPAR